MLLLNLLIITQPGDVTQSRRQAEKSGCEAGINGAQFLIVGLNNSETKIVGFQLGENRENLILAIL